MENKELGSQGALATLLIRGDLEREKGKKLNKRLIGLARSAEKYKGS